MTRLATMLARPQALNAHHAVLRFERGSARVLSPWYRAAVTETLASQIRARAAERGYDKLKPDAQRAMRREIADELETRIQNVVKALKETGGHGGARRPRTITDEHRCPCCRQVLRTQAARDEAAACTVKRARRTK